MTKKALLISILCAFLLSACSTNDGELDLSSYTEKQQTTLTVFNGIFAEHRPESDDLMTKFAFSKVYLKPFEFSEDDYSTGQMIEFEAHGECDFYEVISDHLIGGGYEQRYIIKSCYFSVSKNADNFKLYHKDDKDNKGFYRGYALSAISKESFTLQSVDMESPLIFVKQ